jgi:steroid delta-isomerase-like uncharacterized protein
MTEENKSIVRRVFDEAWNKRDFDVVDEIFSEYFTGHDPFFDEWDGPDGHKGIMNTVLAAFPDARFTLNDVIAEEDRVVTRWTTMGTHKGEFNGVPPTSKITAVTGNTIWRIRDGQIAEAWNNWDTLGLLKQLGAVRG